MFLRKSGITRRYEDVIGIGGNAWNLESEYHFIILLRGYNSRDNEAGLLYFSLSISSFPYPVGQDM